MSLFKHGNFNLHSGGTSFWQIDCDDMTNAEIGIFAQIIASHIGPFQHVVCPESHLGSAAPRLVEALKHLKNGSHFTLIVDDVLTTGNSMNKLRENFERQVEGSTKGVVLFARGKSPDWIWPVFKLNERYYDESKTIS